MAQVPVPAHDPESHCPRCDYVFGPADESCPSCGLDPLVRGSVDEAFYNASLDAWRDANPA